MNLHNKINQYWKLCQALGITPPPNMVSRVVDFAIGTFAYRLLTQLDKLEYTEEVEQIRKILISYEDRAIGTKINHFSNKDIAFIPLDFDNWKTPIGDIEDIYDTLTEIGIKAIICELVYSGSERGSFAEWNGNTLTITLFISLPKTNTIEDFKKAANKLDSFEVFIRMSVEHELVHMSQQIGQEVKKMKELWGLPKRKVRHKMIDPAGVVKQPDPEKLELTPHAFRDVEFYTNLNDSIGLYKHFADKLSPELRKLFLKIFVGLATHSEINEFLAQHKTIPKIIGKNGYWWFRDLKNDEPRWKEALKKFIQSVL